MKTKILVALILIFSLLSFTFASHDPMHSEESVQGCTDSSASNYNPSADTDDGSCEYDEYGCTDPGASNYNANATTDDGSCYYDEYGCTDSTAENYNPSATTDDGSCYYAEYGCTDPKAKNFDANATVDDGSCDYATCGDGTCDLNTERCSCAADCGDGGPICREKPPVTYRFCGDQKALNDETQADCRKNNNARPQDPCVRDDNLCRYPEPTTTTTTTTGGTVGGLITLCVRQNSRASLYFDEMPDLSTSTKIAAFNKTYGGIMCTNGGVVSAPFVFNNSLGTFRVTCINNTSIDTDASRCTYSIGDNAIDGGLTTLSSLNNLTGFTTLTTLEGGINGGLTSLNSLTTLTGGINGGLTSLDSLTTLDGNSSGSLTSLTSVDGNLTSLNSSNKNSSGSFSSLTNLDGELNNNTGGTGNKNGTGTYSISGSVIGDNTDISNVPVTLISNGVTLTTTTDSSGRYSFSGLGVGAYQIKPENKEPYIFYSANTEITDTNIQGLNFSGINLKKVDDSSVAELLRRGSETTGTGDGGYTSLNDWISRITDNVFGGSGSGTGTGEYDEFGNLAQNRNSYANLFSNNSLFQLLNSGYLPFSNSYSPIALSLITKFANQNAVCGNGIAEAGETCDDGINNGKKGLCSSDCLYIGEVRFTGSGLGSSVLSDAQNALGNKNVAGIISAFQDAGNTVSSAVGSGVDIIENGIDSISNTLENGQEWAKEKIIANTSPETRKLLKQTAVVAEEVAKYSVIGVTTLLGVAAASLQVMVFKSQWMTYTIQEGDTLDSIGNKFTMTERAMKSRNKLLKKGLRPGMRIKVRNRHFMEKDYLNQLKDVLKDGLETRHHGKMAKKIDEWFK